MASVQGEMGSADANNGVPTFVCRSLMIKRNPADFLQNCTLHSVISTLNNSFNHGSRMNEEIISKR